ncbi:MAG: NAD(P)H-hydrate dehydratase [Nitrospirota bacterium]|nr:NAD(P)H-hydrate dehydratase [Nitrospirota bacterium]
MKILTAAEMRDIDRRCVEEYGVPSLLLMENAGLQVVSVLEDLFPGITTKNICILAGPGNNGGDGFVVARHLTNRGGTVRVAYLPGTMTADAATNFAILRTMGVDLIEVKEDDLSPLATAVGQADIVVDAVFGTGLSRPVSGVAAAMISVVRRMSKPVVAIDIPSGISSDTGEVMGEAINAQCTVALGYYKRGHILYPGAAHAGEVRVVDIGLPPELAASCKVSLITRDQAGAMMPRHNDAHKGSFGHLLVVAGSVGKTGAACMTAEAALRMGTGLVSVALPSSLNPIVAGKLTEVMTVPLPETKEQTISLKARRRLQELGRSMSVMAVGPGLSTNAETSQLVRDLVKGSTIPLVIDADGLNAVAVNTDVLRESRAPMVLTPHPGEMGRLTGLTSSDVQKNRIEVAGDFARKYGVVLVLKGAGTVVACPDGNIYVNSTGNPGMATAGTGDVLCGVIGGLMAQGMDPERAARFGVFLHGMAGDMAAADPALGMTGMIATDLLSRLPIAVNRLAGERGA